ncbi:MAG: alpha/beta fold hydrolase [Acidobacteriota bacterium]|nr:alpha/beta fold hydrolase [Acidobacteriota bacterium]
MRSIRDLTSLLAAILLIGTHAAAQQAAPVPAEGTASFTIFAGATPIGTEEISVAKVGGNWRISSTGQMRAPLAMTINSFEVTYAPDWHPREMKLDAVMRDKGVTSVTTFGVTTAVTDFDQAGQKMSLSHEISPRTIALPNGVSAAYEAFAVRLAGAKAGDTFKVFVVPQAEISATVNAVSDQRVSTNAGTVELKRYDMTFANPNNQVAIAIDVDSRNRLARVIIASQLSVIRDDLASVSARAETYRNPRDANVLIPANGFNLAGTITMPAAGGAPPPARGRWPAIVLVAGSGPQDRDETVAGIPIFGQLAGELSDAGFIVLRYDKRGVGQSGGRPEAATLDYYAEDVRAAVRWLEKRDDVDKNRIAVVGHSEGAAVGLIAAEKDSKIKALALVAGPGTTGYDLVLEQQAHQLELMKAEPADREAKVALQKKLMDAAVSGTGWDGVPQELRASVQSPWFRSFLTFDPARLVKKVDQPLLVVRAERDMQVPMHHGDKLAALANARRNRPATELVTLAGANHLLVPAKTGEVDEYATLGSVRITPELSQAIARFLNAAFALR